MSDDLVKVIQWLDSFGEVSDNIVNFQFSNCGDKNCRLCVYLHLLTQDFIGEIKVSKATAITVLLMKIYHSKFRREYHAKMPVLSH
jgi:hypothetical protein